MTKPLLSLFFVLPFGLSAQTLDRSVIASAGSVTSDASSGLSLSATIGESIILTQATPSLILTQGFQQPDPEIINSIDETSDVHFESGAWPNPFSDQLNIWMKRTHPADLVLSFCDMTGRKIAADQKVQVSESASSWTISTNGLAAGVYLLQIRNAKGELITVHRLSKSH